MFIRINYACHHLCFILCINFQDIAGSLLLRIEMLHEARYLDRNVSWIQETVPFRMKRELISIREKVEESTHQSEFKISQKSP